MTIYLANVSHDGVRTYRSDKGDPIVAFLASAETVLMFKRTYQQKWNLFGHPMARDGLFLLARPGLAISNVGHNDPDGLPLPSLHQWHPMSEADVEEFAA